MSATKYPNRLRVVMAEKNITNRWLARQLGVTEMTVSRWSTNKVQPSVTQLINIAKILDITLDELVEPYRDKNK
ncbi:Predicted transcriptional regulator [Porphyromonas crevioricanis]|uniref:Predicted transcriptional regulator n=1 Tax=Porphyromonas crevioricanis TaxID=393921 RepID=A0A2X4PGM0_9PORP|nr:MULTISPECIES: helix-turn-helix transcriptional regulator [Porphyromonas]SQH73036.1 Predicted transcriptional regulator [Porphyromonas crevioricanis]